MRSVCLGSLLLVAVSLAAQTNAPAAQSPRQPARSPLLGYVGTWVGTFEGKPWLILKLETKAEQLTGTIQHARGIQLNDNGELKSITEDVSSESVQDAKLTPDGLLVHFKDVDSQEEDTYLMKLTDDGTAEIRPVAAVLPPGMPKPKPWKLVRQGSPS